MPYEREQKDALTKRVKEIDQLEGQMVQSVKNGTPLPKPQKEILKELSTALGEAQAVIADHATDTVRVSDATLLEASRVLKSVEQAIDGIILRAVAGM
jgi:hypothetical protein